MGGLTRGRDVDTRDGDIENARLLTRAAEVVGDTDPAVAARLAELAADLVAGPSHQDVRLRVLGRVEIVDGAQVRPVRGRPAELLALLAFCGPSTAEAVATRLWPDTAPLRGRERLRTVLARTRRNVGPIVQRSGEQLRIRPGVRVDAWEFERLAERAVRRPPGRRAAAARTALALHDHRVASVAGDHAWARDAVHRLTTQALALHDCLADEAENADDPDGAARHLEAALALAPLQDHRILRAARLLAATGRVGRALDLLDRAAADAAEAGIPPSPDLTRLADYLRRRAGMVHGAPLP